MNSQLSHELACNAQRLVACGAITINWDKFKQFLSAKYVVDWKLLENLDVMNFLDMSDFLSLLCVNRSTRHLIRTSSGRDIVIGKSTANFFRRIVGPQRKLPMAQVHFGDGFYNEDVTEFLLQGGSYDVLRLSCSHARKFPSVGDFPQCTRLECRPGVPSELIADWLVASNCRELTTEYEGVDRRTPAIWRRRHDLDVWVIHATWLLPNVNLQINLKKLHVRLKQHYEGEDLRFLSGWMDKSTEVELNLLNYNKFQTCLSKNQTTEKLTLHNCALTETLLQSLARCLTRLEDLHVMCSQTIQHCESIELLLEFPHLRTMRLDMKGIESFVWCRPAKRPRD